MGLGTTDIRKQGKTAHRNCNEKLNNMFKFLPMGASTNHLQLYPSTKKCVGTFRDQTFINTILRRSVGWVSAAKPITSAVARKRWVSQLFVHSAASDARRNTRSKHTRETHQENTALEAQPKFCSTFVRVSNSVPSRVQTARKRLDDHRRAVSGADRAQRHRPRHPVHLYAPRGSSGGFPSSVRPVARKSPASRTQTPSKR